MIQQTSLTAYIKFEPRFCAQQIKIIELLKDYSGLSYYDIANLTGISLSSVCGRMNELKSTGYVLECGYKVNTKTKIKNKVYRWCGE